ncbi:MAG: TolC family protein [Bacteroidetes bacterium]|nr:TolC family protein [Bacteroidota bacterium]
MTFTDILSGIIRGILTGIPVILVMLYQSGDLAAQDISSRYDLTRLLDTALKDNYLLRANEKNSLIKQADIEITRTDYLPEISTSLSASFWKFLLPNKQRLLGNSLTDIYSDIAFRYTVYDWGQRDTRIRIKEDEIAAHDYIGRTLRTLIIWSVSDTYFEALRALAAVDAYRNSIEQLRSHRRYAEHLYNIGKVPAIDILKIEVQIAEEERALRTAEHSVIAQKVKLHRLCNLEDGTQLLLEDHSSEYVEGRMDRHLSPDSIYSEALTNHPEMKVADSQIRAESGQKELYSLEIRPELYSYGIASWEHGYLPFGDNFNYNIGIGIRYTIPFLRGSNYNTRMAQSDLRIEQIEDEKAQTRLDIKKEIDLVLTAIEESKAEMSSNIAIMDLAGETLQTALVMYQSGQGAILDVLDAQAIMTKSTIAYRTSMLAFLQSLAKLNYVTGNDSYPF